MDLKLKSTLPDLMGERRFTIAALAKASGVPKSTINEWLSGRTPNPVQASKVAACLGVTLHALLFGVEDRQEPIQKILKEDFFSGTFEITVKRIKL